KQRSCRGIVLAIEAIHMLQAEMICRPRVEVFGHGYTRLDRFVKRDLDLQRGEDARAYFLAEAVHFIDGTGEALPPDDIAAMRISELHRDDQFRACNFHGTGQAV